MTGNSGLYKNTKGAKEHEEKILFINEIVKEFVKYIMDKEPNTGIIYKMDLADLVCEFMEMQND